MSFLKKRGNTSKLNRRLTSGLWDQITPTSSLRAGVDGYNQNQKGLVSYKLRERYRSYGRANSGVLLNKVESGGFRFAIQGFGFFAFR